VEFGRSIAATRSGAVPVPRPLRIAWRARCLSSHGEGFLVSSGGELDSGNGGTVSRVARPALDLA